MAPFSFRRTEDSLILFIQVIANKIQALLLWTLLALYRAGQQGSCKVNWLSLGADTVPIMDVLSFPACSLLNLFLSWFAIWDRHVL